MFSRGLFLETKLITPHSQIPNKILDVFPLPDKACFKNLVPLRPSYSLHLHQSLHWEDRWGTTDDFTASFLHFNLFFTALLDFGKSRPVHFWTICCLLTSSSVCLVFFSLSLCLARWFWPDLVSKRHVHTTAFASLYQFLMVRKSSCGQTAR